MSRLEAKVTQRADRGVFMALRMGVWWRFDWGFDWEFDWGFDWGLDWGFDWGVFRAELIVTATLILAASCAIVVDPACAKRLELKPSCAI